MPQQPQTHPQRFIRNLFTWWAGDADIEDLMGDMDEFYLHNVQENGKWKANWIYIWQVLSLSVSYGLRKRKRSSRPEKMNAAYSMAMLDNYLKVAVRNFSKQKLFTIINVFGLALGMSICLLALSVFMSVMRFDDFQEHKDTTYQINTQILDTQEKTWYASTFSAMGTHLGSQYPFIEEIVRIKKDFNPEFQRPKGDISLHGYFAEGTFFDVFTFPLIAGDPKTVLQDPFSLVLTESSAALLFGDQDPLGKVLEAEQGSFHVTGIVADLKETHFYFEALTSFSTYETINKGSGSENDWQHFYDNYLYVKVHQGTGTNTLSEALNQSSALAEEFNPEKKIQFRAAPLSSVVPQWIVSNGIGQDWDLPSLIFFMAIGLIILLPAIFNYTNLSIARALRRANEIGVRKVVGASKSQISLQFLVETILITLIALLGSIGIFTLIRMEFLDMVRGGETLDISIGLSLGVVFLLFAFFIGIVAGLFPALYFSRLDAIRSFKGGTNSGVKITGIRKGLIIFQFCVSLFFIMGVVAIVRQYTYALNNDHGFRSENVLAVPLKNVDRQLLINEFQSLPEVQSLTAVSHLPGIFHPLTTHIIPNKKDTVPVHQTFIGDNFIQHLGVSLHWGKNEGPSSTRNVENVLVNRKFMENMTAFNEREDSLTFSMDDGTRCRITGVVDNFHFEPLSELVEPLLIRYSMEKCNFLLLNIASRDIRRTMIGLENTFAKVEKRTPFEAYFLEDEIEKAYSFILIQIKIFSFLSTLAITISCLGLLGMVTFSTENRTKEIAIRKIMGASIQNLYLILTRDFLRLIVVAAMIAVPISYFFYDWIFLYLLLKYAHDLSVWEVLTSILFLFMIGFLSIFGQTTRIARTNPAENLRYE